MMSFFPQQRHHSIMFICFFKLVGSGKIANVFDTLLCTANLFTSLDVSVAV